ncbi:MAG TPA: hypothetical protein VGS22_19080 [Thermoanaerobaculia bacterium]|nr:hypothetical protein [Thermoanaerobaculia bacterium]
MRRRTYSEQVDRWQSVAQNIEAMVPSLPGIEAPYADLRQKVEALRAAHDSILVMTGRQHEAVVNRRNLAREVRDSVRRISAISRGQLGFTNPLLDTFGVRSEDPARRNNRRPPETAPPQGQDSP